MTIEFYKNKKRAQSTAKAIRAFIKTSKASAIKVKVVDADAFHNYGGTTVGVWKPPKKGSVGYIIRFRGLKKVGLKQVRPRRR